MLWAVLVEDGIGIVDMDENFAPLDVLGVLLEHSARAGEGNVADLASGLFAAPGLNEFVVAPERSVDKGCVAIFDPGTPRTRVPVGRFSVSRDCRSIKYFLVIFMNYKGGGGLFGDECPSQFVANVIGITTAHGNGSAEKLWRGAGFFLEMTAQAAFTG